MHTLTDSSPADAGNFQQVIASFLSQPGLPFAGILSAERIERIFTKHGNLFGTGRIYSTAVCCLALEWGYRFESLK